MEKDMVENSYYTFAEDDLTCVEVLYDSYKNDKKDSHYNAICSLSESICCRYLKQIIEDKINVSGLDENTERLTLLKSCYSLRKLIRYISSHGITIRDEDDIILCDGYYFSAKNPGPDSFFVEDKDIEICYNAAKKCKEITDEILGK